jgi:uncharacterized FlaG/YvyC family protein
MPLDGLSFSNSGLKMVNLSEAALLAENTVKNEAKTELKKVNQSGKSQTDLQKDEDSEKDLQGRDTDGETFEEELSEKFENIAETSPEGKRKFRVSFNQGSEMVEISDPKTQEIIETLTPEDLLNILSKTKSFSGIFVDRKI